MISNKFITFLIVQNFWVSLWKHEINKHLKPNEDAKPRLTGKAEIQLDHPEMQHTSEQNGWCLIRGQTLFCNKPSMSLKYKTFSSFHY